MKTKQIKVIGAVLLLLIAAWRFVSIFNPPSAPREVNEMYSKLGSMAAEETLKLVGRGSEVILVVSAEASPHVKSSERSFLNTAAAGGLTVKEILRAPDSAWHFENGMTEAYYTQLMQQAAGAAAVVSYVGVPNRAVLDVGADEVKRPAFVAVLPNEYFLPELMKAGRVQLALVPTSSPQDFRPVFPEGVDLPAALPVGPVQDEPEFIDDLLTPR